MKTKLSIMILLLAIALLVTSVSAGDKGNGIDEKGAHFNLNIIGVTNPKNMDTNLDSGHAMFVGLNRDGTKVITDIWLTEGDFQLTDRDGTDGDAGFQLPYPEDAVGDVCYEIYVRALGKPGFYANMTTCYEETIGDVTTRYCDTENTVTIKRPTADTGKNGPVKFQKVTQELAYVFGEPIFSDSEYDYLWQYDNYGLKHAQLRFYYTGTCLAPGNH